MYTWNLGSWMIHENIKARFEHEITTYILFFLTLYFMSYA